MEQQESTAQRVFAIGGVRHLYAGDRFELSDHPLLERRPLEESKFIVIAQELFAESNLPMAYQHRDCPGSLGETIRAFRRDTLNDSPDQQDDDTHQSAQSHGFFATRLECQRYPLPYRSPESHSPPDVGLQTAVVITPPGHEVYTDRLNRLHVRFNWDRRPDDETRCSCWLRMMQNSSGDQWGTVSVPRAGEEVLVGFMDNQLDRPVVLGQVYGGHQPQWHSTGLLSGLKSKEIKGRGYNQLVMDDATGQLRSQLASTDASSQLNLGYLINQRGNQRGERRGQGFELRTDAYGAIRAGNGLYLSSCLRTDASGAQLDAEEAWRQLRLGLELSRTLSTAADSHYADALAGLASLDAFQRNAEASQGSNTAITDESRCFADGAGDTAHAIASGGQGQAPAFDDALVLVASPGGIATTTPTSTHLHSGEHLTVSTGADISIASGKSLVASVVDRISLFVQRTGIKLIAAAGRIELKAQSDDIQVEARRTLELSSTEDAVIIAGKKEILLTSGDAYIRLANGNIDIHAPKTVDIRGARKSIGGPASMAHTFNSFPQTRYNETFRAVRADGSPIADRHYELRRGDNVIASGTTDAQGRTSIQKSELVEGLEIIFTEQPQ